jgi:hypothetical protein
MTVSDFQNTYSWQSAINLGPQLVRLSEELPGSEQLGLCWHLQKIMVELPAAIAADLLPGGDNTRRDAALRLVATLEIIEKVYPALDTMRLRQDVDDLFERLGSEHFSERIGGTAPMPEPEPAPVPQSQFQPQPAPQPVAPTSVAVVPEPSAAEAQPQQPSADADV